MSRVAGALIFIGAAEFLVGMIVAEAYYPNYSVSRNFISDLGATCRAGSCIINEPSATIFNTSAALFGILVLASAFFLWRTYRSRTLTPTVVAAGIGVLGVGLFPETAPYGLHPLFSFVAFFFSGLSAIATYKIERAPFSYISVIIGAITLAALALYIAGVDAGLGRGGMERMVAYPAIIFGIGFGGHLMASTVEALAKTPA